MNVQGIPPLPAEAGECEIMYGKPIEGDLIHSLDGWRERAVLSVYSSPCWLIARPVPPKRLEWKRSDGDWVTREPVKPLYYIRVNNDGLFVAIRNGLESVDGSPFASLAKAKAACQAHADAQRKPATIAETPAVEVQWPEGAIALTKDGGGYMYFTMTSGKPGATWHSNESYKGQEPSQFNGKHFKDCYLINPACLSK